MPATAPPNLFRQAAPFALVGAAHLVLLWLATTALARSPTPVIPPSVAGQLVSQAPVTEPQPLPMQPEPPRPKPVVKPRPTPVPPLPKAPPSERAVTAPLAEPEPPVNDTPAPAEPMQPVPAAAPAPAPSPKAEPEPVAPPRSDASHLNNPAPVYPAQSRRLREEGRVLFDVYILPNGSVGEIRLKRSSGYPRLDEAALEAVRRWRYVPAKRGDEPIPYWYVQPIDFEYSS
ncbi:hypothetical protein C667_00210 [Thauera phenylacetica B4P]|uniref:Protein TonB n=1 Tax=Thauera phenylacetica B4P TaxID=1234382 RepID=N6YXN7_9RHOO|nr:hypothetical protein C667_00210 [Thauera phenylacetica B4P]